MSNITPIYPTRRVRAVVHQVTFDLVPRSVVERLFHAAIAVGWAADDGAYSAADHEALASLDALQKAVDAASQFTVPVEQEVDEPIRGEEAQ